MTRRRITLVTIPLLLLVAAGLALGQRGFGGRGRGPVQIPDDRAGVPDWKVDEKFKNDVFTFVRVQYSDGYGRRGGGFGGYGGGGYRGGGGRWAIDFPDSDLNFSYRLQQLTSLKVNPNPIHMPLTDERLFDYPFLYLIEPGALEFSEEEIVALRRYLLNGGFLMVDDFWGDFEYENFHEQIKRVFPEPAQEPSELPASHEIFRCVYPLKEKPQVPSMHAYLGTGLTYERPYAGDTKDVHYKGIFDDKGRMMVIICHNTDLGDGWEREGESHEYFKEFSEKKSYPMGINIVTYAMTH
jgi:Domain of unknown function (DUF4159)